LATCCWSRLQEVQPEDRERLARHPAHDADGAPALGDAYAGEQWTLAHVDLRSMFLAVVAEGDGAVRLLDAIA
jgi:hypothetical protein